MCLSFSKANVATTKPITVTQRPRPTECAINSNAANIRPTIALTHQTMRRVQNVSKCMLSKYTLHKWIHSDKQFLPLTVSRSLSANVIRRENATNIKNYLTRIQTVVVLVFCFFFAFPSFLVLISPTAFLRINVILERRCNGPPKMGTMQIRFFGCTNYFAILTISQLAAVAGAGRIQRTSKSFSNRFRIPSFWKNEHNLVRARQHTNTKLKQRKSINKSAEPENSDNWNELWGKIFASSVLGLNEMSGCVGIWMNGVWLRAPQQWRPTILD